MPAQLYEPSARDAHYGDPHLGGGGDMNAAQYLLDLDSTPGATFNFCGGMMFGLALSPTLRIHLADVAAGGPGGRRRGGVWRGSVS